MSSSANALDTKTKVHLLVAMTRIGHSLQRSLPEAEVLEKCLQIQADVQAGYHV